MARRKLTPEQASWRRQGRLYIVDAVACPRCKAPIGEVCSGKLHPARLSPHLERIQAYSQEKRK